MKQRKLGYMGRQLLTYGLTLLVFLVLTAAAVYSYMSNLCWDNAAITHEQMATTAVRTFDSYIDQAMVIGVQVSNDTEVVELFGQLWRAGANEDVNFFAEDTPEKENLLTILDNHNRVKNPAYEIMTYNFCGDFISTNRAENRTEWGVRFSKGAGLRHDLPALLKVSNNQPLLRGPLRHNTSGIGDENEMLLQFYIPIISFDKSTTYGYVQTHQPMSPLFELLAPDVDAGVDVYLFDQLEEQRYPREEQLADRDLDELYLTTVRSNYGWSITLAQNRDDLMAPYVSLMFYLFFAIAALFLGLFFAVYLTVKRNTTPILNLNKRVMQATMDNIPSQMTTSGSNDELRQLEESFELMMQRMKTSVALEKKAHLKALQAQMNPHFLYNSLFSISSMAIEAEVPEIPKFCEHLAAILRYETVYDDNPVTLADELKNTTDYLTLMKMRYEHDFSYSVAVDDSLLELRLPRLTLQPIAENCFEHAFTNVRPPWSIAVKAWRTKRHWYISIADNGAGFPAEQKARLEQQLAELSQDMTGIQELQIGGLGLVNTVLRLRLSAGEDAAFTIEPNEPKGTIITLKGACS